jgi:3-dehydroquinate synthase
MIWTGLDIATALSEALLERRNPKSIFFLCSRDTEPICQELIETAEITTDPCNMFVVENGDQAKTLTNAESVYRWLQENQAQRNSLLINVGGGALCDLGGFCASTYMRGIDFWNIPTTLLAAVDAAVGGKTALNLGNHKNYIGTFQQANKIFVSPHWLKTLPHHELLNGWAEVIKHGILQGGKQFQQILKPLPAVQDQQQWLDILNWNIKAKQKIVESDFKEAGPRKLLNLGHTVGHALESLSHYKGQPIAHGHAVACGLLIETSMALSLSEEPENTRVFLDQLETVIRDIYTPIKIEKQDIPKLLEYIRADKKNENSDIRFSLAFAPGNCRFDIPVSESLIQQQLNAYV